MMRAARKRIGLSNDEAILIGDTMETDLRRVTDLGFQSILVLTGSTTRETLRDYPFTPSRTVELIRNSRRKLLTPDLVSALCFAAGVSPVNLEVQLEWPKLFPH